MLRFLSEESGAASAEYALIIVMICLGLGVALWGVADAIANSVNSASDQIAQATSVRDVSNPGKPTFQPEAKSNDNPAAAQ